MSALSAVGLPGTLNIRFLRIYLIAGIVLYVTLAGALAASGRLLHSAFLIGIPAALLIITHPRLALYTFVFLFFLPWEVLPGPHVYIYDIGTLFLVLAAILDACFKRTSVSSLPPLTGNYLFILIALILSAVFGYSLAMSVRPLMRILATILVFLSVYRLSGATTIDKLLRFFFWICAAHAAIALAGFVLSGGQARSFGLLTTSMDDFTMLAAPIGLGFLVWAGPGRSLRYIVGVAVTFGGLIATQSRAPLLFALAACGFLMLIAWRRSSLTARSYSEPQPVSNVVSPQLVRRRIRWMLACTTVAVAVVFILKSLLFSGLIGRFEGLLSTSPGGTFRLRVVLWTEALTAFWQHPILGIGPGNFRNLIEIIPSVRLSPLNYYVRGLSAHNLFLHYLAESGLVGVTALLALFINQFRLAFRSWLNSQKTLPTGVAGILFTVAALLLVTTLLEAAWMWAEFSLVATFLLALIARSRHGAVSA